MNQANRHANRIALQATDPLTGEPTSSAGKVRRPKRWAKVPDAPLGDAVIKKLERRASLGIATPSSVERTIAKCDRHGRSETESLMTLADQIEIACLLEATAPKLATFTRGRRSTTPLRRFRHSCATGGNSVVSSCGDRNRTRDL